MRYPLLAFLVVFVIPPYTAHALLVGKAKITHEPKASISTSVTTVAPADAEPRIHNWTITPTATVR